MAYKVKEGRSISATGKGVLGPGAEVTADLVGGADNLKRLITAGAIEDTKAPATPAAPAQAPAPEPDPESETEETEPESEEADEPEDGEGRRKKKRGRGRPRTA